MWRASVNRHGAHLPVAMCAAATIKNGRCLLAGGLSPHRSDDRGRDRGILAMVAVPNYLNGMRAIS